MREQFDGAVWAGIERRLTAIEEFIPDAPPWRPAARASHSSGTVGLGPALRGPSAEVRPGRLRLTWALAVILLLLALMAGALLVGGVRPDLSVRDERFGPYGILRQGDGEARAALLADGRTITVSGEWQGMGNARARADIWDPLAGFASIDPPTLPRVNPTTTLLLDGRVLVTGGFGGPLQYSSSAIASAEIWDPVTSTFLQTRSMAAARVGHTATLLPDGRVLVVGGAGPEGEAAEAELWDPRTDAFSPAGTLANPRMGQDATLLLDGRVMVAGGVDPSEAAGIADVEVWDPASQSFTAEMSLLDSPKFMSLTRLPTGSVLMAGAFVVPYGADNYRGALIWDPSGARSSTWRWHELGSGIRPRCSPTVGSWSPGAGRPRGTCLTRSSCGIGRTACSTRPPPLAAGCPPHRCPPGRRPRPDRPGRLRA